MTDIVDRLDDASLNVTSGVAGVMFDAKVEIKTLRAKLDSLRTALEDQLETLSYRWDRLNDTQHEGSPTQQQYTVGQKVATGDAHRELKEIMDNVF